MKKHLLIFLIFLLIIVSISCENIINSKENKSNNEIDQYVNPYDEYGKLHNDCIDFVQNYISKKLVNPNSIEKKYQLLEEGSELFALENNMVRHIRREAQVKYS